MAISIKKSSNQVPQQNGCDCIRKQTITTARFIAPHTLFIESNFRWFNGVPRMYTIYKHADAPAFAAPLQIYLTFRRAFRAHQNVYLAFSIMVHVCWPHYQLKSIVFSFYGDSIFVDSFDNPSTIHVSTAHGLWWQCHTCEYCAYSTK